MERAEIDQEQEQFKQQIKELKVEIASLAKQREVLEQEYQRASPLMQKLSRYVGFGPGGKLEWLNFKLAFKKEQLAELVIHPEEGMNGVARLHSLVPPPSGTETLQEKMERMVRENPPDLEPHIRRVYQRLITSEQAETMTP
ncbi:MAG TPA: hypothetical protein VFZ34_32620 [Blastocatellia bacterium]|nr:hypothetical protein [Blastocatellia bacterium]